MHRFVATVNTDLRTARGACSIHPQPSVPRPSTWSSKRRRTDEEIFEERLFAAEERRAWFRGADAEVQRTTLSSPRSKSTAASVGSGPSLCRPRRTRKSELWSLTSSGDGDAPGGCVALLFMLLLTPSRPSAVLKGFVRFLALTLQGHLSEFPTVTSVSSYMWTLYSVLQREGGVTVPRETRTQVDGYLAILNLRTHVQLSTESREKHFASQADVRKLMDACYTHVQHSHALADERAHHVVVHLGGAYRALVESNCYCGLNECLKWKDVEVVLFSDKDAPSKPIIGMQVTARLLKGGCDTELFFKTVFLFPECGANRPYCPTAPPLALGLLDQVWEGIGGPEDIAAPSADLTSIYTLRVNGSKRDLPVFRREEKTSSEWSVSEDRAMNYGATCRNLRYFSRFSGFPVDVRPYDIRHGTSNTVADDISISALLLVCDSKLDF